MQSKSAHPEKKSTRQRLILLFIGAAVILTAVCLRQDGTDEQRAKSDFRKIESQLRSRVLTDELRSKLKGPAADAGQAVFLSVCSSRRARVCRGTGPDLDSAWSAAKNALEAGFKEDPASPRWLKADIVCFAEPISAKSLSADLAKTRSNYYFYGLAFDNRFSTALLEQEMNGLRLYNRKKGAVNLNRLNAYLKTTHRPELDRRPKEYFRFRCLGWICDEEGRVHALADEGSKYGRRDPVIIDKACADRILLGASDYLKRQLKSDGSFSYIVYPRIGKSVDSKYSIIRHAGTIWSLCQSYHLNGDAGTLTAAKKAVGYMKTKTVFRDPQTCYLFSSEKNSFQLGGSALAVLALTEYMDAAQNKEYLDLCQAFGRGILSMMNRETGEFIHSLNKDFSTHKKFEVIFYDGEAAFALCRLYKLTGDKKYLDAAQRAVDRFIAEDYTKHSDHWVAYALSDITKYIHDRPEYYRFALKNISVNMDRLEKLQTPAPTKLEMLLAAFETYDRMLKKGIDPGDFDAGRFLRLIGDRADAQLNGFFFPEYAMYMEKPDSILYAFYDRKDSFRIRIDDVQHNMGGYYAYRNNYERLIERGMPKNSKDKSAPNAAQKTEEQTNRQ